MDGNFICIPKHEENSSLSGVDLLQAVILQKPRKHSAGQPMNLGQKKPAFAQFCHASPDQHCAL